MLRENAKRASPLFSGNDKLVNDAKESNIRQEGADQNNRKCLIWGYTIINR